MRSAALGVLLSLSATTLAGADEALRIDRAAHRQIVVTASHVQIGRVIEKLAGEFGFTIEGASHLRSSGTVEGQMSGPLHRVLARLLRNNNHLIVYSAERDHRVARLIIGENAAPAATTRREVQRRRDVATRSPFQRPELPRGP